MLSSVDKDYKVRTRIMGQSTQMKSYKRFILCYRRIEDQQDKTSGEIIHKVLKATVM